MANNHTIEPNKSPLDLLVESLTQAALRGYFGCPEGFRDMSKQGSATAAVRVKLETVFPVFIELLCQNKS